jgi:mono/diheme cytochrome c family protein
VLLLAGVAAIVGVGAVAMGGISARQEPGRLEMAAASKLRSLAIPASAKDARNPVPASAEAIAEGLEHFADHCAICHANDGSGDTEIGKSMYPRVPDMRKAETQNLTDGELFYIIENGVRLTGMPAWTTGTEEGKTATWHLVHFIRELPRLTPEQLDRMKAANPRSPDEIRQEIEEQKFLQGGSPAPKPRTPRHVHKH